MIKKRIEWIDCCKGLAILLVILGHSLNSENQIERNSIQFIYSFHMPLFFILSCITFNFSQSMKNFTQKTLQRFKRLIIPALIIYILSIFIEIFHSQQLDLKYQIDRLIYASGCQYEIRPFLGMTWFLFVLFLGGTIFDFLQMNFNQLSLFFAIIVCTIFGIYGSKTWYIFSIDVALTMLPFFYCGYLLKNYDINHKTKLMLCLYLSSFFLFYAATGKNIFFIPCRSYTLFPLYYLIGITGTLSLGCLFQILLKNHKMKYLCYLGKNTLALFIIHSLDYTYSSLYNITSNNFFNGTIRIIINIVILLIFIQGKFLYNKFKTI